jgi:uncharacterized protein
VRSQAVTITLALVVSVFLTSCQSVGNASGQSAERGVALVTAAAQGNLSEVNRLLSQGINANVADADRRVTALHSAAANGHAPVVSRLLAAGANPLAVDFLGATPLVNAAYSGHVTVIDLLLTKIVKEKGDAKQARDGATVSPLHAAVAGGHRAVVERLLAAGYRPPSVEHENDAPISTAARAKRSDLVELFERAKTSESQ